MTSGGNVDMNSWVDHVPALIEAWYPGEQGGNALAEILFGDVNPSGKLPVTFERYAKDNPTFNNYYPAKGTNKVVYNEGVFLGTVVTSMQNNPTVSLDMACLTPVSFIVD